MQRTHMGCIMCQLVFFTSYRMKKNLLLLAPILFPAAAAAQGHYNIVYIMTDRPHGTDDELLRQSICRNA